MVPVHAIGGLPRSGSTLLCNLLAQNEAFSVSGTDVLPAMLRAMVSVWSESPEVKHQLGRDADRAYAQITHTLNRALSGWIDEKEDERLAHWTKSRGWTAAPNLDILQDLRPSARLICCVRNPLNVLASLERHYRKRPGLDDEAGNSLEARANALFSPGGMVGRCIACVNDLLDRQVSGVLFLKAEVLTRSPEKMLRAVYAECGIEYPDDVHTFVGVVNRSDEPDHSYLFKHPHEGSGDVRALLDDEWREVFSEAFARRVLANAAVARFCESFGYNGWAKPKPAEQSKPRPHRRPKWAKS